MDKKTQDVNDIYTAYGKFAIEFELLCFSIRLCILSALEKNGLKDQKLGSVILADQTAYPLIDKLRAIITEISNGEQDPRLRNQLKGLFTFCYDMNEKRNKIIHGTWHIGHGKDIESDIPTVFGSKFKTTAVKGLDIDIFFYSPNDFDKHTNAIKLAQQYFVLLNSCIINNGDFSKILGCKIELPKIDKEN